MAIDINGALIQGSGSGLALSPGITFNSSGQGVNAALPGYSGWKEVTGDTLYYSATTGWPINSTAWSGGGLNTTTGVFTCPVTGYYAVGFNGIANGFNSETSQGYAGFAKNGALSYYVHWNLADGNPWNQGGGSSIFSCAAGDTLAFFINRSPAPVSTNSQANNRGFFPTNHHAIWCVLIG